MEQSTSELEWPRGSCHRGNIGTAHSGKCNDLKDATEINIPTIARFDYCSKHNYHVNYCLASTCLWLNTTEKSRMSRFVIQSGFDLENSLTLNGQFKFTEKVKNFTNVNTNSCDNTFSLAATRNSFEFYVGEKLKNKENYMKRNVFDNKYFFVNVKNINHDYFQLEGLGLGAADKKKKRKIFFLELNLISLAFSVLLLMMLLRFSGKAYWEIKPKKGMALQYYTSLFINTQDKTLINKWNNLKQTSMNFHNKQGIFLKEIGFMGKIGAFSKEYG